MTFGKFLEYMLGFGVLCAVVCGLFCFAWFVVVGSLLSREPKWLYRLIEKYQRRGEESPYTNLDLR